MVAVKRACFEFCAAWPLPPKVKSGGMAKISDDCAYVAHLNGVKDELTALENLLVAERISGREQTKQQAGDTLSRVGLANQRHLPARFLSAGQRRRLALARLLASNATLWILDEILTSLDDSGVSLARDLITDHVKSGGMAIVATHQELNLSVANARVINLSTKERKILFATPADQFV